ncbi:MAG: ComF family protein [Anaerolineales bacterium]|nr:ComF family protein [Anaerolineales bacterium]
MRKAIHRLKYDGDMSLGDILSRYLISMYKSLGWQVDMIAPVPISPARRAQRGYNQAALLAFPLALGIGVEYTSDALEKVRETPTQVGLDGAQRRQNVAGAFEARPAIVQGKRVLIVDDVMTSGATLETCSQALVEAGACQVYGLTLGRVIGAPGLDTGL